MRAEAVEEEMSHGQEALPCSLFVQPLCPAVCPGPAADWQRAVVEPVRGPGVAQVHEGNSATLQDGRLIRLEVTEGK